LPGAFPGTLIIRCGRTKKVRQQQNYFPSQMMRRTRPTGYAANHFSHARRLEMRSNGTLAATRDFSRKEIPMAKFSKGDHVSWNSEASRVSGRIIKIHESDFLLQESPPTRIKKRPAI